MESARRLQAFAAAVVATAILAFLGANHAGPFWSRVLVTPWALVLTGILFVALVDQELLEAEERWIAPASHVLAGGTLAFVVHDALIQGYREVLAWPLDGAGAGAAFMAAALLLGLVPSMAYALKRRDAEERWAVVGAAALLTIAGAIPGLSLLPAVTVIGLQLVFLGALLGVPLDIRTLGQAGAWGAAVFIVGLVGLMAAYGQLVPPRLKLDLPLATRWIVPLSALAACVSLGSLAWSWRRGEGQAPE